MAQRKKVEPCPHGNVAEDGRIVCKMILSGDNEVSPNLCRECPARAIACDQLRFSLQKIVSRPITVRYATGRVEVLDDQPPRLVFQRAACAEQVVPVDSPLQCAACELRSRHTAQPATLPARMPAGKGKIIPFPQHVAAVS